MPKTSDHKLIRSPFPIGQSLKTAAVPVREAQGLPGRNNHALADAETQKQSAFTSGRLPDNKSALADVETWKNVAFQPNSLRDKNLFLANTMTHHPTPQRDSPSSSSPPSVPGISIAQQETLITPPKRKRAPLLERKKISMLVMIILLLVPSFLIIFELISAIVIYKQMQDGISHLQTAENVFRTPSHGDITNYLNVHQLDQAQLEIDAARGDFTSLSNQLDHNGMASLASNLWPTQISTARAFSHVAVTGMQVAQHLLKTMRDIAPSIAPAFQKSSPSTANGSLRPYLTPASYQEIQMTLETIAPLIHRMVSDAQGISLASLPMRSKQRETFTSILSLLPVLDVALPQIHNAQNALRWFLGIDEQRSFLVEPMDSAELRATGGFTGQFGELTLNGVHIAPIKLSNIGKYEEDHTAEGSPPDPIVYPKVTGQSAPKPYSDWWPVGNFGLRDANLSADFPTSARIAMDRYHYEFGHTVDGVIMFTPALIQHVLHVTGPIKIPLYHQTITEQNLEDLLHYYQLNNTGIRQEELIEHVDDNQIARKLFTQRVTQALISTITHLPFNTMLSLANEMFLSMKSKDLQVYVSNSQLEAFIGKYGSTASLDRSNTHDGFFIVQSNLSASKASQYVTTSIQDSITLNNEGGATHHLQMTLNYQQKGDVYGFDTYRDYVRIYVPVNSQLLEGNGFDQYDRPYCGDNRSGYNLCLSDVYGDGSLICTLPLEVGYATSYLNDPYAGQDHPLDEIGLPHNLQSDETGRAMFGGWVVIPKNCTMKVTLSWYVPPAGKQPYHLLLQAQASVYSSLDLTIHPSANACSQDQRQALHFSEMMDGRDLSFTVKQQAAQCILVTQ